MFLFVCEQDADRNNLALKMLKPPLFGSAAKCTWHEVQDAIREMLGSILTCGCASGSDMRQQNQSVKYQNFNVALPTS